jgi:ribosome-associated protein
VEEELIVTEPVTDPAPGALPRPDGLPSRTDAPVAQTEVAPLDIARMAVEAAEDKKAADIVLLDVTGLTTVADYFVICSGGSERQLAAIVDAIVERVHEVGVRPYSREGAALSHWLLLDLGSVIVHVLAPPERDFYQLERLWAQAKTVVRVQ